MKMQNADITRYQNFAKYVLKDLPLVQNDQQVVAGMRLFGHLDSAALMRAVQWGTGPDIKIVPQLGSYGAFTAGAKSNEIRISQALVLEFEAGTDIKHSWVKGQQHLAVVTLLHELCHWGDDQIGDPSMLGEDGDLFEKYVYGGFY
ncbi:hypothetical protein GCM10027046_03730 [Uliginosibacterium flavum]|uniref:Tox-MPTase3 domain-containing protein n=1 Tax=Uliginosibacterium flavum TaxID=1396831 RepID=A0ABV2TJF3_9RHOO